MTTNEFLKEKRIHVTTPNGYEYEGIRPRIVCVDGFEVSVQASKYHYCQPRIDGADNYESVELGMPSAEDDLIIEFAEEPDDPTGTVYGWVPVEIVDKLIEKHGGIVNFKEVET